MIRVILGSAALVILLAVVGGGVVAASRAEIPTTFEPLFTTTNGVPCAPPCLMGVRPNAELFEAAITTMRQNPLTTAHQQRQRTNFNGATGEIGLQFVGPGPTAYLSGRLGGRMIALTLWYSGPSFIGEGDAALPVPAPRLGDVILRLGPPERVVIDAALGNAKLFYGLRRMVVEVALYGVGPTAGLAITGAVRAIGVGARPGNLRYTPGGDEHLWAGFRSARVYR